MPSAAFLPRLRLVGAEDPVARATWARERRARQAVLDENRRAGGNPTLDPTDPRWALAVRAYTQLEGSSLAPERRQRVLRTARHLGIRPFDANLIIAIAQDHARRGEPLSEAAPTLSVLAPPRATRGPVWAWLRWVAVLATALTANALLIWWLLS